MPIKVDYRVFMQYYNSEIGIKCSPTTIILFLKRVDWKFRSGLLIGIRKLKSRKTKT